MIAEEWADVLATMIGRWPQTDWATWEKSGAIGQYLADLEDLPAEHVQLAVDALARDGRRWPPPAGEIRKTVISLAADAPEWGEVSRILHRCAAAGLPGSPRRDERLAAQHPLVQAFVRQVGWQEASWAAGGWDGSRRDAQAQVREKWTAFVRRVERDLTLVGLPAGELRALQRVNGNGPRPLAEAIGRALPAAIPKEDSQP